MALVKAAEMGEIPEGESKAIVTSGKELAIFNVDGEFFCVDNYCPHLGAPLDGGWLSGEIVTCPWHAWQIDVKTGEVLYTPGLCVATYPCTVEGGSVFVEV